MDFESKQIENLISTFISLPTTESLDRLTSKLINNETVNVVQWILPIFQSFVDLENWAWRILSENCYENFENLLKILATINRKVIFDSNDVEMKLKLIFPSNFDLIDQIFIEITRRTNDDHYFSLINLWLENVAFLNYKHIEFGSLPLIISVNDRLLLNFFLNETFIDYLDQLNDVSPMVCHQQEFYLKILPFFLNGFFPSRQKSILFDDKKLFQTIGKNLTTIFIVHCRTISTWSKEFFGCLTQLSGLISVCSWLKTFEGRSTNFLQISNEKLETFLNASIDIVSYQPFHHEINNENSNYETIFIEFLLGILIHFASIVDFHEFFRNQMKFIETLMILDHVKNERINLISYRIQSSILSEEEIKQLDITKNIDEIFFRYLRQAWAHPLKMHNKIPIDELLKGFLNLSKNDIIKSSLIHSDQFDFLIDLADFYPIIYDILWSLSFDNRIRDQINSNRNLRMKIERLTKDSSDEQMQKILFGLIWNLDFDRPTNETNFVSKSKSSRFDLMISYSHKDKEICQKIYEELRRQGLKIWIDFNEMHGNMMDAMAQGIEQSQSILLCLSEDYRQSNFCRAEAQYAFKRRANLIPILVQRSYKPDGWLLFLISGLFYVDFTKFEFDQSIEILLGQLKSSERKIDENSSKNETKIEERPINLRQWTTNDVQNWLFEYQLPQMSQLLSDCDGPTLIYLNELMKQNIFKDKTISLQQDAIQKTGRSISLIELARFQNLMDQQIPVEKKQKLNSCCPLM